MPTAPLAIACLLLRMAVSQMDVPARQAFVMAVVPPEERAAAASVTNVPRSLAAGLAPLIAGALLEKTSFGWPLIIGGTLKAIYDLALLVQFRAVVHARGRDPLTRTRYPARPGDSDADRVDRGAQAVHTGTGDGLDGGRARGPA